MGGHLSRRPDATRPITAVWFAPVEHPAAPDPTPLKIVRVGLEAAAWLLEPLGFSEWGDPAAALDAPGVRVSRVVHIDPRGALPAAVVITRVIVLIIMAGEVGRGTGLGQGPGMVRW